MLSMLQSVIMTTGLSALRPTTRNSQPTKGQHCYVYFNFYIYGIVLVSAVKETELYADKEDQLNSITSYSDNSDHSGVKVKDKVPVASEARQKLCI